MCTRCANCRVHIRREVRNIRFSLHRPCVLFVQAVAEPPTACTKASSVWSHPSTGAGSASSSGLILGVNARQTRADFGAGIDANELWFSQQGNNLVVSVLGTTDKVTISNWFAGPGNVVETIKSGDGKVLNHSDVATLVAAMAGFNPATSPSGTGIQPGDPLLGNPAQTGTIAAAMQSSWMAA